MPEVVSKQEHHVDLLLLDERAATRRARTIGLRTLGTLGVLLMAKDRGFVATVKPLLDGLVGAGFRMSDDLHHQILDTAGEVGEASRLFRDETAED